MLTKLFSTHWSPFSHPRINLKHSTATATLPWHLAPFPPRGDWPANWPQQSANSGDGAYNSLVTAFYIARGSGRKKVKIILVPLPQAGIPSVKLIQLNSGCLTPAFVSFEEEELGGLGPETCRASDALHTRHHRGATYNALLQ